MSTPEPKQESKDSVPPPTTRRKPEKYHPDPRKRIPILLKCIFIALLLIAAVEYFKYGTRINYEWFHCTPRIETIAEFPGTSVRKIWSQGGPSCDKRGEFKTLLKRITRDYEPNDEHLSFCIVENTKVGPVHYPIGEPKGEPGYVAYVGYDRDAALVESLCEGSDIFHF